MIFTCALSVMNMIRNSWQTCYSYTCSCLPNSIIVLHCAPFGQAASLLTFFGMLVCKSDNHIIWHRETQIPFPAGHVVSSDFSGLGDANCPGASKATVPLPRGQDWSVAFHAPSHNLHPLARLLAGLAGPPLAAVERDADAVVQRNKLSHGGPGWRQQVQPWLPPVQVTAAAGEPLGQRLRKPRSEPLFLSTLQLLSILDSHCLILMNEWNLYPLCA